MRFPLLLNKEMPSESSSGREYHNNSSTMVVLPAMVFSSAGELSRPPTTTPQSQGLADKPNRPCSPPCRARVPATNHLQSIRGQLQHKVTGVSGRAAELLLAGWSKGTNTVYQSGWSRCTHWCDERETDTISCGIQPFLDFLSDLFKEGQYRIINSIRSAVSMTHNPIGSTPIGQHPLVSRLMKGIYNSRPPEPQYSTTWDVSSVLDWIKRLGNNKDLSLKVLSGKLALLMALVSANRTSELQVLDLGFRSYAHNSVRFRLASLTKKWTVGALLKVFLCIIYRGQLPLCSTMPQKI